MKDEILKHILFINIASNLNKKSNNKGNRYHYNKQIMGEYYKNKINMSNYQMKDKELNLVINMIDRYNKPNEVSYNIEDTRDQHGVGCYNFKFKVVYEDKTMVFQYHTPKDKKVKHGRNNYPKIETEYTSNYAAVDIALKLLDLTQSGISKYELYA